MSVCREYALGFYGDLSSMQASISARAAFENEPLDSLYSYRLFRELRQTIGSYRSTGNVVIVREAIDRRIVASLRSVDGLLAQGDSGLIPGGIEIEMRTIDAVNYSVRCSNDEKQTRVLYVGIPVKLDRDNYLSPVPGLQKLTKRQIHSLRYRFTLDGWKTFGDARARVTSDYDELQIGFLVRVKLHLVARVEGAFYLLPDGPPSLKDRNRDSKGYVFAVPDQQELRVLVSGPAHAD
jgi:hypothetical protein